MRPHASQEQTQAARRWLARSWNVTHPYGSGGVYANFPDPELSDPARAYYRSNLDRLHVVKRNYDLDGVFHSGPAGSLVGTEVRTGTREEWHGGTDGPDTEQRPAMLTVSVQEYDIADVRPVFGKEAE